MDFPQLLGPFYQSFSSKADCERAMNVYLEQIESGGGRGGYVMMKSPGLRPLTNFAQLTSRGSLLNPNSNFLFQVEDDTIYALRPDLSINATLSPIANDGLPVSMDQSANSLFIVSAGILYRVFGGALTTPVTPFIPAAVGVIGALVVALEDGTNRFYFSSDDGATWNGLDFQTAEAYPNALINLIVDHQELWLFGNRRTQVFVVGGDPDAPFVQVTAGLIEYGIAAKRGVTRMDNSIFLLGADRNGDDTVYRINGYSPVSVSNFALENAIRQVSSTEDAILESFQLNGHSCLRLTIPSANGGLGETWHYDADLPPGQAWTEAGWWNWKLGQYERHRGQTYVSAFGKIIVGDHSNGWLYELTPDEYTDYGFPLRWYRRTTHSTKENLEVKYARFEVVVQPGVGLLKPLWLNEYTMQRADFVIALGGEVFLGNVTAAQALVLQDIYDYKPYTPLDPYPSPDTMHGLGFFPWGARSQLDNGTALGADPQLGMCYSDDGAEVFTPYSYRNMGGPGQFHNLLDWWYLGKARDRVWEIGGEGPVKYAVVQGTFKAELCYS